MQIATGQVTAGVATHDAGHAALGAGNLVGAARIEGLEPWHRNAALALIGAGDAPLRALTATDNPEARLFQALALWIDGQDAEAEAVLAHAPPSEAASRLRALLQASRIKVLAFLPPHRSGPHSLFGSVGL